MEASSSSSRDKLNISHEEYLEFNKLFSCDNEVGNVYGELSEKIPEERLYKRMTEKRNEQDSIQKKTFTKWINNHLKRHPTKLDVKDLYTEIKDGLLLIYLIEVLSSVKLNKEKGPRMQKVHYLSNIKIALSYLSEVKKIKLININPADLVEGKPSIVLGLIWQIILYFQIQEHDFEKQKSFTQPETTTTNVPTKKIDSSVKSKLLSWVQINISESFNIKITDFTKSWQDGVAFNALINIFKPDLIMETEVRKRSKKENLDQAFIIAEEQLGIARLLDSEDILAEKPDEKSIITYVSQFLKLPIPEKDSPKKKRKVSENKCETVDLADINMKKIQFIKDVKDSGIAKIKHIIEFSNIFKLVSALLKQLTLIPNNMLYVATGDPVLTSEFRNSIKEVLQVQWLLDESITNEWSKLLKWISSSEKIILSNQYLEINIGPENIEKMYEEINTNFQIFEEQFKYSPKHVPIINEFEKLKSRKHENTDFISYSKELEKRLENVIKDEVITRRKIITYKTVLFLKNTEKKTKANLRQWKKELESLKDAEEKLLNCQTIIESENLLSNVSKSLELLSVNSDDNQNFFEWLKTFRSSWSDIELELKSVFASLTTYIEQWKAMDQALFEMDDWLKKNKGVFRQQEELNNGKKKMQALERLVGFISEQSSIELKTDLQQKLIKIRERFEKLSEEKVIDIDELRMNYNTKIINLKKWLEKTETLIGYEIECSLTGIEQHLCLLTEANKSEVNVQEDFKILSKLGQSISRQTDKSETDKMLGELKIQKIRLINLMNDLPKNIEKMIKISDKFRIFEDLYTKVDEQTLHCENKLADMSACISLDDQDLQNTYKGEVETCLKIAADLEGHLKKADIYIEEIDLLSAFNLSTAQMKDRIKNLKERVKNIPLFAEIVETKVKETLRFINLKDGMKNWITDIDNFLEEVDHADADNVYEAIENHIQETKEINVIVKDLEQSLLPKNDGDDMWKDDAEEILKTYQEKMTKLKEAGDQKQAKILQGRIVDLIRTTEIKLDAAEIKAKSAKIDSMKEIIAEHENYLKNNEFGRLSHEILEEMKIILKRLKKSQLMESNIEMLEQQCEDVDKRIVRISKDFLTTLSLMEEKRKKVSQLHVWVSNLENVYSRVDSSNIDTPSEQYDMVLQKLFKMHAEIKVMEEVAFELIEDKSVPDREVLESSVDQLRSITPLVEIVKVKGPVISEAIKVKEEIEKQVLKMNDLHQQITPFRQLDIVPSKDLLGQLSQQERIVEEIKQIYHQIKKVKEIDLAQIEMKDPAVAKLIIPKIKDLYLLCQDAELHSNEVVNQNLLFATTKQSFEKEMDTVDAALVNLNENITCDITPILYQAQTSIEVIQATSVKMQEQLSSEFIDFLNTSVNEKTEKLSEIHSQIKRKERMNLKRTLLEESVLNIQEKINEIKCSNTEISMERSLSKLEDSLENCKHLLGNLDDIFDQNFEDIIINFCDIKKFNYIDIQKELADNSVMILKEIEGKAEDLVLTFDKVKDIDDLNEWKSQCGFLVNEIILHGQTSHNFSFLGIHATGPQWSNGSLVKGLMEHHSKAIYMQKNYMKLTDSCESIFSQLIHINNVIKSPEINKSEFKNLSKSLKEFKRQIETIKEEKFILIRSLVDEVDQKLVNVYRDLDSLMDSILVQENEADSQVVNELSMKIFEDLMNVEDQLNPQIVVDQLHSYKSNLMVISGKTTESKEIVELISNPKIIEKITKHIDKLLKNCKEISEQCDSKVEAFNLCKSFLNKVEEMENDFANGDLDLLRSNLSDLKDTLENLKKNLTDNQIIISTGFCDMLNDLVTRFHKCEIAKKINQDLQDIELKVKGIVCGNIDSEVLNNESETLRKYDIELGELSKESLDCMETSNAKYVVDPNVIKSLQKEISEKLLKNGNLLDLLRNVSECCDGSRKTIEQLINATDIGEEKEKLSNELQKMVELKEEIKKCSNVKGDQLIKHMDEMRGNVEFQLNLLNEDNMSRIRLDESSSMCCSLVKDIGESIVHLESMISKSSFNLTDVVKERSSILEKVKKLLFTIEEGTQLTFHYSKEKFEDKFTDCANTTMISLEVIKCWLDQYNSCQEALKVTINEMDPAEDQNKLEGQIKELDKLKKKTIEVFPLTGKEIIKYINCAQERLNTQLEWLKEDEIVKVKMEDLISKGLKLVQNLDENMESLEGIVSKAPPCITDVNISMSSIIEKIATLNNIPEEGKMLTCHFSKDQFEENKANVFSMVFNNVSKYKSAVEVINNWVDQYLPCEEVLSTQSFEKEVQDKTAIEQQLEKLENLKENTANNLSIKGDQIIKLINLKKDLLKTKLNCIAEDEGIKVSLGNIIIECESSIEDIERKIENLKDMISKPSSSFADVEVLIQSINNPVEDLPKIKEQLMQLTSHFCMEELEEKRKGISTKINDCVLKSKSYLEFIIDWLKKFRECKKEIWEFSDSIDFISNENMMSIDMASMCNILGDVQEIKGKLLKTGEKLDSVHGSINIHEVNELKKEYDIQIGKLIEITKIIEDKRLKALEETEKLNNVIKYIEKIKEEMLEYLRSTLIKIKKKSSFSKSDIDIVVEKAKGDRELLEKLSSEILLSNNKLGELYVPHFENVDNSYEEVLHHLRNIEVIIAQKNDNVSEVQNSFDSVIKMTNPLLKCEEIIKYLENQKKNFENLKKQIDLAKDPDYFEVSDVKDLIAMSLKLEENINQAIDKIDLDIEEEKEKERLINKIIDQVNIIGKDLDNFKVQLEDQVSAVSLPQIKIKMTEIKNGLDSIDKNADDPYFTEYFDSKNIVCQIEKCKEVFCSLCQESESLEKTVKTMETLLQEGRSICEVERGNLEKIILKDEKLLKVTNEVEDSQSHLKIIKNKIVEEWSICVCIWSSEKIVFIKEGNDLILEIDTLLQKGDFINNEIANAQTRKQYLDEIKVIKGKLNDFSKEEMNRNEIIDKLNDLKYVVQDFEETWKDNDQVRLYALEWENVEEEIQNITNYFTNYFVKFDKDKEDQDKITTNLNEIETRLKNEILDITDHEAKLQFWEYLRDKLPLIDDNESYSEPSFKEVKTLQVGRKTLIERVQEIKRKISKNVDLESFSWLYIISEAIIENLKGSAGNKSMEEITNEMCEVEGFMEQLRKQREEIKLKYKEDVIGLELIKDGLEKLKERIKLTSKVAVECNYLQKEHTRKMTLINTLPNETMENIQEKQKALEEHRKNIISENDKVDNVIFCIEIKQVNNLFHGMLEEVEDALEALNANAIRIVEQDIIVKDLSESCNSLTKDIDSLRLKTEGNVEQITSSMAMDTINELFTKVMSMENEFESKKLKLTNKEKTHMTNLILELKEEVSKLQMNINSSVENLNLRKEDVHKLKTGLEPTLRREIDSNSKEDLIANIEILKSFKEEFLNVKKALEGINIKYLDRRKSLNDIEVEFEKLDNKLQWLGDKKDFITAKENCIENLNMDLDKVFSAIEAFESSLIEENSDANSEEQFLHQLTQIRKTFSEIRKPELLNEREFKDIILKTENAMTNCSNNFQRLTQDSKKELSDIGSLEDQINRLENKTRVAGNNIIDKYNETKDFIKTFKEMDDVCNILKEAVLNTKRCFVTKEQNNLNDRCDKLSKNVSYLIKKNENDLKDIESNVYTSLEKVKNEQESWLQSSITSLQVSTSAFSASLENVQSRKNAIGDLEQSLIYGDGLLEEINSLEEQMKTVNPEFRTNDCVYVNRKISQIEFKDMIKDSKQRFNEIVDKYTKSLEMFNDARDCLSGVRQEISIMEGKNTIDYIKDKLVKLTDMKRELESKDIVIKELVEIDKQLTLEGFSMEDLNVIELENNQIKTHEDIDDLLGSLRQIEVRYNEIKAIVSTEKSSVFLLLEEIKEIMKDSDMNLSERIKDLRAVKQRIENKLEAISLLKEQSNDFHKDNIESQIPRQIEDLEQELTQCLDSMNRNLSETLEQLEQKEEYERRLHDVIKELQSIVVDIGRIMNIDILQANDEDIEDATEEAKHIQQRFESCQKIHRQLLSECSMISTDDFFSEFSDSLNKTDEALKELKDKISAIKIFKVQQNQTKVLLNNIESEINFIKDDIIQGDSLQDSLMKLKTIQEDMVLCKTSCNFNVALQCLTEEEEQHFAAMKESMQKEMERLELLNQDMIKEVEEGIKLFGELNSITTEFEMLRNGNKIKSVNSLDNLEDINSQINVLKNDVLKITEKVIASKWVIKTEDLCEMVDKTQKDVEERKEFIVSIEKVNSDLKESEFDLQKLEEFINETTEITTEDVQTAQTTLEKIEKKLSTIKAYQENIAEDLCQEPIVSNLKNIINNQIMVLTDLEMKLNEKNNNILFQLEESIQESYVEEVHSEQPMTTEEIHSSTEMEIETSKSEEVRSQLEELTIWIGNRMKEWTVTRTSLREGGKEKEKIKFLVKELVDQSVNLAALEQWADDERSGQHYRELKMSFSVYENEIKTEYTKILDLDSKMETFQETLSLATMWINDKEEIYLNNKELRSLNEERLVFEETVLNGLQKSHSDLCNLDYVKRNVNLLNSINGLLGSLLNKYEKFQLSMIEVEKTSPLKNINQILLEAEEFINVTFPQWYKNQLRNTIVNSKECMIRVTETKMKKSLIQNLASNINKLVNDSDLPWPKILLDVSSISPQSSRIESKDEMEIRHSTVRSSLWDIYHLLNKWMATLEDLKIKWQELTVNQEQFQSWMLEIKSKNDVYYNQSFKLDQESLLAKINSLQILKKEIEDHSKGLVDMMLKDDQVTTVTFSPEINNAENLAHTNTLSDKINIQYLCLIEKIIDQINRWRSIIDKFDNVNKSSEDLKSDFNNLKERLERLESNPPIMIDQWHFLQSPSSPVSYQTLPKLEINNSSRNYLRNSGSNHGISKLFWPYSHIADHSVGDCESNKLSRSLICLNSNDLKTSGEFIQSSNDSTYCFLNSYKKDKNTRLEPNSFRPENNISLNLNDGFSSLHIKKPYPSDLSPVNSSRYETRLKRIKRMTTPVNASSGYRSSSSSLASTYRY